MEDDASPGVVPSELEGVRPPCAQEPAGGDRPASVQPPTRWAEANLSTTASCPPGTRYEARASGPLTRVRCSRTRDLRTCQRCLSPSATRGQLRVPGSLVHKASGPEPPIASGRTALDGSGLRLSVLAKVPAQILGKKVHDLGFEPVGLGQHSGPAGLCPLDLGQGGMVAAAFRAELGEGSAEPGARGRTAAFTRDVEFPASSHPPPADAGHTRA